MTNRDLIVLAAKAVGYDTSHPWNEERLKLTPPVDALCIDGVRTAWDPIDNDDDALRLAAMLRFQIIQPDGFAVVYAGQSVSSEQFTERSGNDIKSHRAALRRAIVRAAAYIGERGA